MANQASGFQCPTCGSLGDHDIVWLDPGVAIRLVCVRDETLWTEALEHG